MSITGTGNSVSVEPTTVGVLLNEALMIPPYQRPYSWRPDTALQLLDDIREAARQKNDIPYVLGAVILHNDNGTFNIVDGQQRLITLCLLLELLSDADKYKDIPNKDTPPIVRVIRAVKLEIKRPVNTQPDREGEKEPEDENKKLAEFIKTRCQLIRIVTKDIDEAFRIFDSQNYRGKPLAPHDLLKAYHLRAMRKQDRSPAMTVALVEAWESAGDAALDRLFSRYLYRISRWLRGERAPQFTAQDIGLFKGISPDKDSPPHAHYHNLAQATIPLLTLMGSAVCNEKSSADAQYRAIQHARFQLDAPLVAGHLFFERITFMLAEVNRLTMDMFSELKGRYQSQDKEFPFYRVSDDGARTEPPPSRYRYVADLYLAVALYYTNKFGEENFSQMRDRLFAWAYAPRIKQYRVQYQSVDNLASDCDPQISAFKLIRNAVSAGELRGLPINISRPKDSDNHHENELVDFLTSKGFEINERN
ncbi:DUF262 domain-containing protein [Halothiobacillus sp. DCM-1]|uniref:DUF262 domain-containing protein n=1 Tax=Halothiobacillus sp. DCM-1 TaxID=3112558 RepID=UPI00324F254B